MEYGFHKRDRNCGGKYPDSTWAKSGFEIGPVRVNQCPKTYVDEKTKTLIEIIDTNRMYFPHRAMKEVSAKEVEIWKIMDFEREKIRRAQMNKEKIKHGRV